MVMCMYSVPNGCPHCGGKLLLIDTIYEEYPGDRDTPPLYVPLEYIYQCEDCEKIIKSDDVL